MSTGDLVAQIAGVTSLDAAASAAVVKMAQVDPPGAAQLLQAYQDAAEPGTPNFVEEAWAVLQAGLGIALPLASALETLSGVPGAAKVL